jgi:ribosomal protein S27E
MRREREPIPKLRSSFYLIKCPDCGEERIVFSCSAKDVGCRGCGRQLAQSKGGHAIIFGQPVKKLD